MRNTWTALALAGALATAGLAGCGDSAGSAGGSAPLPAPSAPAPAAALVVKDPWVKAAPAAERESSRSPP